MTSQYAQLFTLLNNYSRKHYQCFLAELFLNKDQSEYMLCFRPTGGNKESPNRYACRYLRIDVAEAGSAAQSGSLPPSIIEKLDLELPALGLLM